MYWVHRIFDRISEKKKTCTKGTPLTECTCTCTNTAFWMLDHSTSCPLPYAIGHYRTSHCFILTEWIGLHTGLHTSSITTITPKSHCHTIVHPSSYTSYTYYLLPITYLPLTVCWYRYKIFQGLTPTLGYSTGSRQHTEKTHYRREEKRGIYGRRRGVEER